jgi:hypothetical protein
MTKTNENLAQTLNEQKQFLSELMQQAWRFVKRNGLSISEALRKAWLNAKLKFAMKTKIVKFYFQKIDGSLREAYGTLNAEILPPVSGNDTRKKNDTVQVYFDTEKQEYRCFKTANLERVAL